MCCILQRGQAEEPCVVAEVAKQCGLPQRLPGLPADAPDSDERSIASAIGAVHLLPRQSTHGPQQPCGRIASRELRGVHADRETARARSGIVARQRALVALVEPPARGQGEWVRRDHESLSQRPPYLLVPHTLTPPVAATDSETSR